MLALAVFGGMMRTPIIVILMTIVTGGAGFWLGRGLPSYRPDEWGTVLEWVTLGFGVLLAVIGWFIPERFAQIREEKALARERRRVATQVYTALHNLLALAARLKNNDTTKFAAQNTAELLNRIYPQELGDQVLEYFGAALHDETNSVMETVCHAYVAAITGRKGVLYNPANGNAIKTKEVSTTEWPALAEAMISDVNRQRPKWGELAFTDGAAERFIRPPFKFDLRVADNLPKSNS